MNVFYKLCPEVADRPIIAVPLDHDVEITVFGDDGRDATFKGRTGDYVILEMIEEDRWSVTSTASPDELEDMYVPIGGN